MNTSGKKMVINYTVLIASILVQLEHRVIESMHHGWQPIGGIVVDTTRDHTAGQYLQTMVQYKSPNSIGNS